MAKVFDSLVAFLADKDLGIEGMPLSDVPEKLRDGKLLAAAWADGAVEFGRRHHTFTGSPNQDNNDNKRHAEECRLDGEGYSWTGGKKTTHKPMRDLLKEEDALPQKVVEVIKVEDRSTNPPTIRTKRETVSSAVLKLRIRLTEKGYAALASVA